MAPNPEPLTCEASKKPGGAVPSPPAVPPSRRITRRREREDETTTTATMRRHALRLVARALYTSAPPLPAPPRHRPQVTALGGWISRSASVGFFSTDAAAVKAAGAAQGGPEPAAAAAAGASGGGGEGGGRDGKSEQAGAGKSVRGGPVSWLSFLLLLVTGGGIIVYYDREKKRHIEELKNKTNSVKPGQSVGTAAIGGPFTLLNHDGKPVTEKDFLGKWTLLYFGFTHCPDICPDELQKMAAAINKIKERAKLEIVPVFITVDPDRDTVEQVRDYVKEFHQDLIGLTGTTDEVRQVARAYRVYYMKTEEEGSDYLVDHSIVMYLMNPKMEFVKFFGKNYDEDSLAEGIIKEIREHKSS